MSKSKKKELERVNEQVRELQEQNFFARINHQSKIDSMYGEQQARERIRSHKIAVSRARRFRRWKWERVRNCCLAGAISWALYHAQIAGLIDLKLAIPAMCCCLVYVAISVPDICRMCNLEHRRYAR